METCDRARGGVGPAYRTRGGEATAAATQAEKLEAAEPERPRVQHQREAEARRPGEAACESTLKAECAGVGIHRQQQKQRTHSFQRNSAFPGRPTSSSFPFPLRPGCEPIGQHPSHGVGLPPSVSCPACQSSLATPGVRFANLLGISVKSG